MQIKQLRSQKGWSQEQLAELTGLNIRTIQRIESGQAASNESLMAIAAVFGTDISQLQNPPNTSTCEQEQQHTKRVFWVHLSVYFTSTILMFIINWMVSPEYYWAVWSLVGWGFAIMIHGIMTFGVGPGRESNN